MKFHMERKFERIDSFSSDSLDQILLVCDGDDDDPDAQSIVSIISDAGKGDPIVTTFDDPLSAMIYFRDQKAHWGRMGYHEVVQFTPAEEIEKMRTNSSVMTTATSGTYSHGDIQVWNGGNGWNGGMLGGNGEGGNLGVLGQYSYTSASSNSTNTSQLQTVP
jgi:hypothetical protein